MVSLARASPRARRYDEPPLAAWSGLSQVEQQEFGVSIGFDGNRRLVFDCRSIAFAHLGAVNRHDAAGELQPYTAAALDFVYDALIGFEIGDEEARVLMHRDRAIPASGGGSEPQLAAPFLNRKCLLLITRR